MPNETTLFFSELKAALLCHQRQRIVLLNEPHYDYIGLTSGGIRHSTLTIIREGNTMYCVFAWPNAKPGVKLMDGPVRFNIGLLDEYIHVGSQFQVSISEYVMDAHGKGDKPELIVYCGSGWGGAMAKLMATVVPPDHVIAFDEPLVWHESVLAYLDDKMKLGDVA